jgi:ABC-type dipeptide/oligopeptide/nickel transport system ATPase component
MSETSPLVTVENLRVSFKTYGGRVQAVRDVSFHVEAGECVAVVGESGCGKSVTAKALMGLIDRPGLHRRRPRGLSGRGPDPLYRAADAGRGGKSISMIFQDPMTSLNPTMTVGKQIAEVMIKHQKISRREGGGKRTIDYLKLVGIANPQKRCREYPDSLSGGMPNGW